MRKIKKTVVTILQAWLIAYALQMELTAPLCREDYKSGIHYLYAWVTGLLGGYSMNRVLIFVLAAGLILWVRQSSLAGRDGSGVLAAFFPSAC